MSRRTNSSTNPAVSVGDGACATVALGRRRVSVPGGNGAGARATFAQETLRPRADSFPPMMPLGEFFFEYLYRCGVRHSFGIPGDFVLPTFTWLEKSKIQSITMTHEPAAGFAADAYSRINGIGLVCVSIALAGSMS